MAKYRLIAIDLDGTLLSPAGKVTPRTKAAVHRALSAGLLICFATGRNLTESRRILEEVAHYATAVFVGGAVVVDTQRKVTLHRRMMEPKLAAQVCGTLERMGYSVTALQEGVANDYLFSNVAKANPATQQWLTTTRSVVRQVKSLARHAHRHTIRVGIVGETQEVLQVQAALEAKFGGRILVQCIHSATYDVEVLEVFDPAVNKWEGVLNVARRHHIKPAQIIAIGDEINDLPMIRGAGLGVAMGNAKPSVLAAAKLIIKSNEEEGLAQFLEQVVEEHLVKPQRA